MKLQGDTLALRKYTQEQYGGLTEEEITKKVLQNSGMAIGFIMIFIFNRFICLRVY